MGVPVAGSAAGGPRPEPVSTFPRKPLGFGLIAAGGAGVVVGAIMGGLAVAKHKSLVSACPTGVCVGQDDAISAYHTYGTASDVGLFVGGAVAVAGIVLVVTAPKAAPATQGWVTPVVGPGFAGAVGRF